jgi:endonuclease/exonuclease/phosphatase family metal-dependent hydrolase
MMTQMKLLQLNLWGGRLENPILNFIKRVNPDILCLQEAIDIKGGNSFIFASTEEIQAAVGADYIFMSPIFNFKYMNRRANFGNCIISKYPIKSSETIFTGKQYVADFDFLNQTANIRNLQHAVIEINDRLLHILNHHGHHIHQHKNGDAETMRQCRIIAQQVKKLDGNLVLAGDFNLTPHSESLKQINQLLTNLSIKDKLKTTRTQFTHKKEVCDYIFVSDATKVNSFKAMPDIVSDHKALVMEFEI